VSAADAHGGGHAPGGVGRVDVGGHALHVVAEGGGAPVLLLHGFTGTGASLAGLARALRALGHRTISVDFLGHGASDAPEDGSRYGLERCGQDLGRVLDATGDRSAHVFGYSMGGRVAIGLALLQPERVRSLAVLGASAGIADATERAARRAQDEALADTIEHDGLEAFVDRWMRQPLFASQQRLGPEALARARSERLAQRAHGLAASLRGLGVGAQPAFQARLRHLAVPALFLAGAEDEKFVRIGQELAALVPRGRFASVAEAGHAAHLEQPRSVQALLAAFLAGAAAAGSGA